MFEDVGNHVHVKLLTILFVQGNFVHEKHNRPRIYYPTKFTNLLPHEFTFVNETTEIKCCVVKKP